MRPGDFSPGNCICQRFEQRFRNRFNEAGGFLPRKPTTTTTPLRSAKPGFNEAGGFLPRKRLYRGGRLRRYVRFNEAGGFLPRKLAYSDREIDVADLLQ